MTNIQAKQEAYEEIVTEVKQEWAKPKHAGRDVQNEIAKRWNAWKVKNSNR